MTTMRDRYHGSQLKRAVDSIVKDSNTSYIVTDENGREVREFGSLSSAISYARGKPDWGVIVTDENGDQIAEYDNNGKKI